MEQVPFVIMALQAGAETAAWTDSNAVDALSIGSLLVALASLAFRRFLPNGLGGALFGFGVAVAASLITYHAEHADRDPFLRIGLIGAILTPFWTFVGFIFLRRARTAVVESRADWGSPTASREDRTGDAILAWAIIGATIVCTCALYMLLNATWPRIINPMQSFSAMAPDGLITLVALGVAIAIWQAMHSSPHQPAAMLALAALFVWWSGLMIPSASLTDEIPLSQRLSMQPGWWTWTFQIQIGLTLLLIVAAVVQDLRFRRRRKRAWPDRLDDLLLPYSRWPAYIQLESLIAAAVLILGVHQIVRSGGRGWMLPTLSGWSSIGAGAACLYMTYRRWSANTAGLGMALISLAIATFACAIATPFCPPDDQSTYAERMPILFNAVLFALAAMIFIWGWLARVWDQQLLDGTPWTTTGRMIPYANRTAFLLAAIAILIAFQMTLWRERALSAAGDDSTARIVTGVSALVLLAIQSAAAARRRNSIAWAAFAIVFLIAIFLFLFVRLPMHDARGWFLQYEPVALALTALPMLLLAEALPKTEWRAFSTPLWFLALLFLPLKSLVELLPENRLPADWVRPTALGLLSLIYFIAGGREHRRAFHVLGAALLIAAGSEMYRLFWR